MVCGEKVSIPLEGIRTCTLWNTYQSCFRLHHERRHASRQSKETLQTLTRHAPWCVCMCVHVRHPTTTAHTKENKLTSSTLPWDSGGHELSTQCPPNPRWQALAASSCGTQRSPHKHRGEKTFPSLRPASGNPSETGDALLEGGVPKLDEARRKETFSFFLNIVACTSRSTRWSLTSIWNCVISIVRFLRLKTAVVAMADDHTNPPLGTWMYRKSTFTRNGQFAVFLFFFFWGGVLSLPFILTIILKNLQFLRGTRNSLHFGFETFWPFKYEFEEHWTKSLSRKVLFRPVMCDSVDLALMIDETNENISVGNVRGQMSTCFFYHKVYPLMFVIVD